MRNRYRATVGKLGKRKAVHHELELQPERVDDSLGNDEVNDRSSDSTDDYGR
jgi:hypothetical protein